MGVLVKNSPAARREEIGELEKYGFHEPASNKKLDGFTVLAAILLDAPMAVISIVDESKIWYVSRYGIEKEVVPKEEGICVFGYESNSCFYVEDTLEETFLKDNPMVTGEMGLRFYAGIPLVSAKGRRLGSLCVMDRKPKQFSSEHRRLLELVAGLLMQALEENYQHRSELELRNEMLNSTVHDLKNPLAVMPLLAQMIKDNKEEPEMVGKLAGKVYDASRRLSQVIEDFLTKAGEGRTATNKMNFEKLELTRLVKEVVLDNKPLATRKKLLVHFRPHEECQVLGDRQKLKEMLDNLLSNAIKFSFPGKSVWIELAAYGNTAVFKIRDEGVGLSTSDLNNLYRPFTTLSGRPTAGEHSSGLGLSIVKTVVEAHNGRIRASSAGESRGTTFIVEIPLLKD